MVEDVVQRCKASHGVFVAIEGASGVGITTLLSMISKEVAKQANVVSTYEPHFPSIATWLREGHSPTATALAMLADRIDHLSKVVYPAIADNAVVMCGRYDVSTWVYNVLVGGMSTVFEQVVADVSAVLPVPDLYIQLDAPAEVLRGRIKARAAEESKSPSQWILQDGFLEKLVAGYRAWFDRMPESQSVLKLNTNVAYSEMWGLAEVAASRVLEIRGERMRAKFSQPVKHVGGDNGKACNSRSGSSAEGGAEGS